MTQHCANPDCPGLARDGFAPEFVDGVVVCLDCGATLMRGAAPDDPPQPREFIELCTVFIGADAVQAHLVRGLLEAEGIQVHLKGEALPSAIGELPVDVARLEVQVPSEDRERARSVVQRFEKPTRSP